MTNQKHWEKSVEQVQNERLEMVGVGMYIEPHLKQFFEIAAEIMAQDIREEEQDKYVAAYGRFTTAFNENKEKDQEIERLKGIIDKIKREVMFRSDGTSLDVYKIIETSNHQTE